MRNKLVLKYSKTPLQELRNKISGDAGVRLFVKREDLNHPHVSGNKWWKLKHNLEEAQARQHSTLLTFGGAYSNHLYATAAAANEVGLKSIGVVRGQKVWPMNDMLAFEESMGMRLHFVSRDQYRAKAEPMFIEALRHLFGDFYLIPEGGSNDLGVKGCEEFAHELDHESGFDYLCLPVGTGATMAGLANALPNRKIIGISVLKGGEFLKHEVGKFLKRDAGNWELFPDFHFGGYGKVSRQLVGFITDFEHQHKIPLDPVYTAKMFFGVMELVKGGYFPKGARVLLLHTGGLQGRKGFNF